MADTNPFDLGQFMPGFKFLQGLATGAGGMGGGPALGHWVAPTVDISEIERRISELKAVQFWLEQNQMGVKATIQALEVQKMTLSTLRTMNVDMAEMAKAFRMPTTGAGKSKAPEPAAAPAEKPHAGASKDTDTPVQDPMQWWGALTEQFQQIATQTLAEAARAARPPDATAGARSGKTRAAAAGPGKTAARSAQRAKTAGGKSAAKPARPAASGRSRKKT